MKSFKDLREKTLTPAEKKKREEIAKAMERENPGMDMKKKMAIATWQAKKVAEAKDPNEYDKEGDMMKNQLRQICSANEKLMKMVGDDDNLPEWVQNKVTKATDYIRSVRDYLEAEDSDEDDESMEESVTISPLQKIRMDKEKADRNKDDKDKSQAKRMTDKQYAGYKVKMKEEAELNHEDLNSIAKDHDYAAKKHRTAYAETRSIAGARNHEVAYNRHVDAAKAHREAANDKSKHSSEKLEKMSNHAWDATDHVKKRFDEEVELDEISRDLARRYIRKVADKTNTGELSTKQVMKRRPGVNLAGKKAYPGVAGEPKVRATESAEQIDELSKKTLTSYVKKAAGDAVTKAYRAGDVRDKDSGKNYMKALGRQIGISTATNKLTKEEAEELDEISGAARAVMAISTARRLDRRADSRASADNKKPESGVIKPSPKKNTGYSPMSRPRFTNEEAEELDELDKKTLGSYIKKASTNQIGNTAKVLAGKNDSETERARRRMGQRMSGIAKATDKLTKEEAEQIDELSKKTLGSYVKKAKDDLGNREAEVTRNRYVDPRGVKDPVKHNNTLLMKRANRRDNINKAVDKLTKEAVQSADKKPERYIRPDGKVGIRMVKTDKKMIKND